MQQTVELVPVGYKDLDDFVKRLQKAFTYATRSDFPDFLGNIPPQRDVDEALDGENAEALSIVHEGKDIGGAVITGGAHGIGKCIADTFTTACASSAPLHPTVPWRYMRTALRWTRAPAPTRSDGW